MFIFQVYLKNFYIFIVVLQIYMQFFLFLETQKRLETHLSEILDKTTKENKLMIWLDFHSWYYIFIHNELIFYIFRF